MPFFSISLHFVLILSLFFTLYISPSPPLAHFNAFEIENNIYCYCMIYNQIQVLALAHISESILIGNGTIVAHTIRRMTNQRVNRCRCHAKPFHFNNAESATTTTKFNPFHSVSAPISFSHHAMIAINADDDYWLRENQHDSNLWLFLYIPVKVGIIFMQLVFTVVWIGVFFLFIAAMPAN